MRDLCGNASLLELVESQSKIRTRPLDLPRGISDAAGVAVDWLLAAAREFAAPDPVFVVLQDPGCFCCALSLLCSYISASVSTAVAVLQADAEPRPLCGHLLHAAWQLWLAPLRIIKIT